MSGVLPVYLRASEIIWYNSNDGYPTWLIWDNSTGEWFQLWILKTFRFLRNDLFTSCWTNLSLWHFGFCIHRAQKHFCHYSECGKWVCVGMRTGDKLQSLLNANGSSSCKSSACWQMEQTYIQKMERL